MKNFKFKLKNNSKMSTLPIIILTIACLIIPNALLGTQRNTKIFNEENIIIEVATPHILKESSVYYEVTSGDANGVYINGD